MGLVFVPIYIHYLGIDAYGLIGVYASLQVWFSLLDLGLSPTINREMSRFMAGETTIKTINGLLHTVETLYLWMSITIAVLIIMFSPWMADHWLRIGSLSEGTVMRSLMLAGIIIAFRWMSTIYRSAILGLQNQVWLSSFTAIIATIRSIGTIVVLAGISRTLEAFFIYQGLTYLIETIWLFIKTHSYVPKATEPPRMNLRFLRSGRSFIAGMGAIGILSTILMQLDKVVLSRLVTLADFGYFSLASSIAGSLYVLIMPISNVAYPRFTTLVTREEHILLSKEYHKLSQLLSITLAPTAFVMIFFAHDILFAWTGSRNLAQHVAPIMSVLVAGYLINGILHVPYMAQLGYAWYHLKLILLAVATPIAVASLLIFVPRYGVQAAAWVWLVLNAGILLVEIPMMHLRILRGDFRRWLVNDTFYPMAASLLLLTLISVICRKYLPQINRVVLVAGIIFLDVFVTIIAATVTYEGRRLLIKLFNTAYSHGNVVNINGEK